MELPPEEGALKYPMPGSEAQCELAAGGVRIGEDESARERALTLTLLISKSLRHKTRHRTEDEPAS